MNIVFAASEGVPFSKTGGLADVVGALPRALAALGHQVSVFLPRYSRSRSALAFAKRSGIQGRPFLAQAPAKQMEHTTNRRHLCG